MDIHFLSMQTLQCISKAACNSPVPGEVDRKQKHVNPIHLTWELPGWSCMASTILLKCFLKPERCPWTVENVAKSPLIRLGEFCRKPQSLPPKGPQSAGVRLLTLDPRRRESRAMTITCGFSRDFCLHV